MRGFDDLLECLFAATGALSLSEIFQPTSLNSTVEIICHTSNHASMHIHDVLPRSCDTGVAPSVLYCY